MATVYITAELISRVKSKISNMHTAERKSDLPDIDKNINADASQIFNIGCWGAEHVHLINVIPKDWLVEVKDGNVSVKGLMEDGSELKAEARFCGMFSARQRPSHDYWNRSASELTIDQVRELAPDTVGRTELLQRWEDTLIARDIAARWAKVEKDITEFLKKCKSLNEAVKLFPNVRMYLHHDDIERLERKVERASQRKAIVEAVDTEGLTAAAIAAKLSEAS